MFHFLGSTTTRSVFVSMLFAALAISATCSAEGRFCTPYEAIADVEDFRVKSEGEEAEKRASLLQRQSELLKELPQVPHVATKDLMSPEKAKEFNEISHKLVESGFLEGQFSNYVRDVHVIAELIFLAEMQDRFGIDRQKLEKEDPRLFYLEILDALRVAQPEPQEGYAPNKKDGCTIYNSLSLIEHFTMMEMARQPTNKGMLNLILDSRRIETLANISGNKLRTISDDVAKMKWSEDKPVIGDGFSTWVSGQSQSTQNTVKIWNIFGEYMPSRSDYEAVDRTKRAKQIIEDNER